jgi:hypothetical protein
MRSYVKEPTTYCKYAPSYSTAPCLTVTESRISDSGNPRDSVTPAPNPLGAPLTFHSPTISSILRFKTSRRQTGVSVWPRPLE